MCEGPEIGEQLNDGLPSLDDGREDGGLVGEAPAPRVADGEVDGAVGDDLLGQGVALAAVQHGQHCCLVCNGGLVKM